MQKQQNNFRHKAGGKDLLILPVRTRTCCYEFEMDSLLTIRISPVSHLAPCQCISALENAFVEFPGHRQRVPVESKKIR